MNRRTFLGATAGALAAAPAKKTVAAIVTAYYPRSHADVICSRIFEGYSPEGVRTEPRTRIVSMYTDQVAPKDMSRDVSARYGFKIWPTIAEALTLGTGRLAVDAVLFIGEHGNYSTNDRGQKLYPRYELFRQILDVLRKNGRAVPVFCDKHLSWSWRNAKEMYDWSRELRFPFTAGSSIPLTVRVPELEFPLDVPIEHAVSVGYGDLDAYGFHTLETLQCMVERRRGAEQGIAAVELLEGDAVWKWRDGPGRWSAPLLDAALATAPDNKPGRPEDNAKRPAVFLLEYRDGFQAASYMLEGHNRAFLFAARVKGRPEPAASHFGLVTPGRDLPHFDGLVDCIEKMFVTGKPVNPVERTLLTTGALSFLFESRARRERIATPELDVRYRAPQRAYFQKT
ncbi:MAG TPA: hypothetical protein VN442_26495 [Bryobacteraceae bacterium]|nr:hypothetical protein [Bryobacteraceae bacterium]